MRFACCMTKATDTYSEYVIIIAFALQQWLTKSTTIYVISVYISVLFYCSSSRLLNYSPKRSGDCWKSFPILSAIQFKTTVLFIYDNWSYFWNAPASYDKHIQHVQEQTCTFIVLQTLQPSTCFGHLIWPSSGRCSLKDVLHRTSKYSNLQTKF